MQDHSRELKEKINSLGGIENIADSQSKLDEVASLLDPESQVLATTITHQVGTVYGLYHLVAQR
jgi:hypothetical protein